MASKGEATKDRILAAAEELVFNSGFAGTSLDEIIERVGVTKGGFFYHFKSKADLAQALIGRWARSDHELFSQFSDRATALADDPLQDVLLFLKLFEEYVDGLAEPLPGCLFASYTYESSQFNETVHEIVKTELDRWGDLFEDKFAALVDARSPRIPVTAHELREVAMCSIEGGLVLGRVYGDRKLLMRQSEQLRNYVQLLFSDN